LPTTNSAAHACRVEIPAFQKSDEFLIFYQMARAGLLITSPGEPAGRAQFGEGIEAGSAALSKAAT
jgi:hypothetical protein